MKINDGPGDIQHCCDCGSMQPKFYTIQHGQHCRGIRREQDWKHCPYHDKTSAARAEPLAYFGGRQ